MKGIKIEWRTHRCTIVEPRTHSSWMVREAVSGVARWSGLLHFAWCEKCTSDFVVFGVSFFLNWVVSTYSWRCSKSAPASTNQARGDGDWFVPAFCWWVLGVHQRRDGESFPCQCHFKTKELSGFLEIWAMNRVFFNVGTKSISCMKGNVVPSDSLVKESTNSSCLEKMGVQTTFLKHLQEKIKYCWLINDRVLSL